MGIRIIWASAVDEAVNAAIEDARSLGKRVSIICPSTTVETAVGYKMAEHKQAASNLDAPAVKIESLGAYLGRLWSWNSNGKALIESATRVSLIDAALEDDSLKQSMLQSRGMRRALESFVTWAVVLHPSHADTALGQELGLFYRKYNELLDEKGLIEKGPALDFMASRVGDQSDPAIVVGFSDLQIGWKRYFNQLATYTHVVYVLLGARNKTISGVIKQSMILDEASVFSESEVGDSEANNISFIRETIFNSSDNQNKIADDSIRLVSAAGDVAQRLSAVDETCKSLLERPNQRHALLFRNLAPHALGICQELEARGVAYDIDIKMAAKATGLGRALYCVLAIVAGEDDQKLASSYALSVYSGISLEKATEMNRNWRKRATTSSMLLGNLISAGKPSGDIVVSAFKNGQYKEVSGEVWTALLGQLLSRALGKHAGSEFTRKADVAAHKAILASVSELEASSKKVSPRDIFIALQNMEISLTARPGSANVLVADMYRARGLAFDMAVLAGLSSGEFGGASDYLPADRLNSLAGTGTYSDGRGGLLPISSIQDREKVFIYEMLASVQRKAVLVYKTQNDNGSINQPSLFLEEIFNLVNLEDQAVFDQKTNHTIKANLHYPADSEAVLVAQSLHTLGEVSVKHPQLLVSAIKLDINEDTVLSPSQIEAYVQCPYYWFIHRYLGLKDIDEESDTLWLGVAVHELLRLFYTEWMSTEQSCITQDNMADAHDLLVKYANQLLLCVNPDEETDENWLDIRKHFYNIDTVKAVSFMAVIGNIDKMLSKEAKFSQDQTASNEGEYLLPQYFEYDIGTKEDPVVIAGKVKISGRADRIDISNRYITVVDYKGSVSQGQNITQITNKQIQLALYLVALQELTKQKGPFFGKEIIGGTYLSYKSGERASLSIESCAGYSVGKKNCIDEEAFFDAISGVASLAADALGNMIAGSILPPDEAPKQGKCKYCSYDGCVHFLTGGH